MGDATQYTVNNQMVNATLMNIADSPTNVQLPGKSVLDQALQVCFFNASSKKTAGMVIVLVYVNAGVYKNEEIPRVPIVCTGNDFSTLYAPLIRDGRMEKYYWNPTREVRHGCAVNYLCGTALM